MTANCKLCGTEFENTGCQRYCCAECAEAARIQAKAESDAVRRAKEIMGRNDALKALAKAATDAGMTYGQYQLIRKTRATG